MTQTHGFVFEEEIVRSITGIDKIAYNEEIRGGYFSSMDIVKGYRSDTNYSIKTSKNCNLLYCADILRFMDHCLRDEFTMIVGVWKQINPTTKRYFGMYELMMSPEHYGKIWSGLLPEHLKPLVDFVRSIPPGQQAKLENRPIWKGWRNSLYETHGRGLARIDGKVDSKNQRRIQCYMHMPEIIASGIPYRFHSNTTVHGVTLPFEQESAARTFTRKRS